MISGAVLLTLIRLVDKEALEACLSHIIIITALCMASSERGRTERLYKSAMLIYALDILIMSFINQLAIDIANFLYVPDEAFINSIRVQAIFIANLIALTPIIAPLVHLARLIYAFERTKEAEAIVKSLEH
ncbi:MAG: hypothetical protein DRN15_11195 [Thermoprotei archaeon]|nr:MAG: hypothetical protein DRN15_11195 [Thermoprotei archaeon]